MKKRIMAAMTAASMLLLLAGCGTEKNNGIMMDGAGLELCTYDGIQVEKAGPAEVAEADVDEILASAVEYYNASAKSTRTDIREGDTIYLNIYLDGDSVDGATTRLTLGSGATFPEIEAGLVGKETGDTYDIPVSMDGTEVTAHVTPAWIAAEPVDPADMDDADAEALMTALNIKGVQTVEGLRASLTEQLEEQNRAAAESGIYDLVWAYLKENCTIDPFPEGELQARVEKQMLRFQETCREYYGMTVADYLENTGTTEKAYREGLEENIREEIRMELILTAVGDREGIGTDEEGYRAFVDSILAQGGYGSEDELYGQFGEDYVRYVYRSQLVMEWLVEHASVAGE